ncbi:unnamed protein product [Colletotrichum noveboracense]|uniref:Class I SAM-dependent methyltransferase n=1 Tax=Colletotrichum noveboracense TaxID=2664923 RepID=A0A9W4W9S0_9PEZI|nr:hypothetical protein K456DRAFT_1874794 [Colletotrichum gloeosporioides 23]KAJ0280521.1 hypothetical protein COL940_006183 [Colletotrichum noveboracense]KAJ0287671.1 hypothetical protein CBS470a_005277 [Colletotrichum nupharicola]KAJ0315230.1 hypothetical protein Brms1b_006222 [Colletotrichum noveboracense]CAI0641235.1 unnamed protein product [Colletotrichum noveboracense]
MAPLVPRFHLFEIDDQPWFPSFLRALVQEGLHATWVNKFPVLQTASPAHIAAQILQRTLGTRLSSYTFIDFCAGSGGPTPAIERAVNRHLTAQKQPNVDFVLTDLWPNPESWARAAAKSEHIGYEPKSVDAANAPRDLLAGYRGKDKKIFRLFNLAFHHFDDPLAKAILKNTLETSDGFAIFELQGRDLYSIILPAILGIGVFLLAPLHAWKLGSLNALIFTYLVPILPFVLVFDGYISALRTRTPDEVEALMRSCGARMEGWEVRSGKDAHIHGLGYVNWIVAEKISSRDW